MSEGTDTETSGVFEPGVVEAADEDPGACDVAQPDDGGASAVTDADDRAASAVTDADADAEVVTGDAGPQAPMLRMAATASAGKRGNPPDRGR